MKKKSNEDKANILGSMFLENNRDSGTIIYKNKIYEFKKYFEDIDINYNHKDKIIFLLFLDKNNKDISYIFFRCHSLISVEYYDLFNYPYQINQENNIYSYDYKINEKIINNNKILDDSNLYKGTKKDINDISEITEIQKITEQYNYNTNHISLNKNLQILEPLSFIEFNNLTNLINMSCLFYGRKSLISLPNISNWNTSDVEDMSYLFFECESLRSIPDISKWNTKNVENMSKMFNKCKSLISLPDISKWNVENIKDMSGMFNMCKSLISLPNI